MKTLDNPGRDKWITEASNYEEVQESGTELENSDDEKLEETSENKYE